MENDNRQLLIRAIKGEKEARELLVIENTGLVYSVARRFLNRGYDLEDLFQIGCIGLIKSIDKFDITYDVKFSTYAVPMITGEIKRFLRDDGMMKVSRSLKENGMKIRQMQEKLRGEYGREPLLSEVSEQLQLTQAEVIEALEANYEVDSLQKTVYQSDGNEITLMEKIEDKKDENEQLVNQIAIKKVMELLEEREERIIRLRYFEEKTQTEIAKILGISQVQISRIEKKVLEKLRKELCS